MVWKTRKFCRRGVFLFFMKKISNGKIKKFIPAAALIVLLMLVFVFTSKIHPVISPVQNTETLNPVNTSYATLEINGKNLRDGIIQGESVYDFMAGLRSEGEINFTDKNYSGMGEFIDSIAGTANSGEKNWIYYVNGKKANIGISNYKLGPGDVVSWKYEKDIN